tara:strand:+ start:290 stop:520 length:231 start_codon:yes stop_codon:yes gene_type:complete
MIIDIFLMNGYGLYVWSAFVFTFLICLTLYLKTKKTLNKLEKDFKEEVKKLSSEKVDTLNTGKISKEILTSQTKVK